MIHLARAVLAEENPSFRAVFTTPTQPKVTVLLRYDETGADGYLHYVARVVVGPHNQPDRECDQRPRRRD
jgi:hypothetical protein